MEAQKSVSGIKKQHLTEVRSMANPPPAVKLAMESVCTMLGHQMDGWKTVQQIIRRDDFISSIVNFDTDKSLTVALRDKMRKEYLSNPDYNFETVNRASKACGPLVQWAIAQVRFSDILDRVGPLREEVQHLESSAEETKLRLTTMQDMINELENSITKYKEEYATLISETQQLKQEMEQVKQKVERSLLLLDNLSTERVRWDSSRDGFSVQMKTLVGDTLISSAFLAYAGYYSQSWREELSSIWSRYLSDSGIPFKGDLLLVEYLSSVDARLKWSANSLPTDDLCFENAVILSKFNRYPLIIDPSGQALEFLRNEYKDRKIMVTSFLDSSFLKNLESALRFGCPLVIRDVECYDPILNPVLNRETYRNGGRTLLRLGSQEIDFSPLFQLFLFTRDASMELSPDLSSRVTIVNFTVTRGSLQSQCLSQVLAAEKPDIDEKRRTLQKLQGEFKVRLRQLENSLLQALSGTKGTILEDDTVVATLETLKQESMEIQKKVDETDTVLREVETAASVYTNFSRESSSIFFCLDQLHLMNHFYRFDLKYFQAIFHTIITKNPNLEGIRDAKERLKILSMDLLKTIFRKTARSLLHEDVLTLAFLFAQIHLRDSQEAPAEEDYIFLLGLGSKSPMSHGVPNLPSDVLQALSTAKKSELNGLFSLASIQKAAESGSTNGSLWKSYMTSSTPLDCWPLPKGRSMGDDPSSHLLIGTSISAEFQKVLVAKALRPDILLQSVSLFAAATFGVSDLSKLRDHDLKSSILEEMDSNTPLLFCAVPGYDASFRVEQLAADISVKLTSVAMGSPEGYALADNAILSAGKDGSWVLLKNVHLSLQWLGLLEKKLYGLRAHPSFRLFMTLETNDGIPASLVRLSRVFMFEPPNGVRDGLLDNLNSISEAHQLKGPAEKSRLYFLLAFLHTQVLERMRYRPLGWSKSYDFSEADFMCAIETIDYWLELACMGKANISPAKIPWNAICTLFTDIIYGGRVDNDFDKKILVALVNWLFQAKAYEPEFPLLVDNGTVIQVPEGTKQSQYLEWIAKLPSDQPPTWFRLSDDVDDVIRTTKGMDR